MPEPTELRIIGVPGMPEVEAGDSLPSLIAESVRAAGIRVIEGDVFVVAQKVVSKAEGRTVRLAGIEPGEVARDWAARYDKDARMVEVVLRESRRIVRMERGVLISETHHGFVCANAGVDASNVAADVVTLLPEDADRSARGIQSALEREFSARVAVIVSDTFGRPWREGITNVAIGVAGIAPLVDYRGRPDSHGRPLKVTVIAIADELASAAELLMRKTAGVPVVIVRGFDYTARDASARELIRPPEADLFR
ncbi:MAG TPA: coenzyme F420-0:L-glutamate ligase [Blastocatellia bacterium]|nr:coenzyme F420-0:L-glutamate ligase [Blastocatellia bacterium]